MLQSEFFERTKLSLTVEEYKRVEAIYVNVKMDKDEFCKQWMKLKANPLISEIAEAMIENDEILRESMAKRQQLEAELEEQKKYGEESIGNLRQSMAVEKMEFAKRIVRANEEGELRVYDVIEEEYGIGFIIKTKHEAGIPLSEDEINYMVGKL